MTATIPSGSRTKLAGCPSWCRTDHSTDEELRVHVRQVGPLGVEVSALERNGQIEAPSVYLPEVDLHGDLTPEQAAMLGQQLLQAVAVLDSGSR